MCPDANTLVAMIEQALDPAQVLELEGHFDSCRRCHDLVRELGGSRPLALGTPGMRLGRTIADDVGDAAPGTRTIAERYEVGRLLGRGGMGAVYLARDITLDREVALKLHRAGTSEHRLHREALAMAKLAHPNVVTVFEIGSVDDQLFVAMEYVRGGTLRDWLAATKRPWRDALAVLLEVGAGLAAAHAAGLIHRDFKPENVLVGDDRRPRVGDFGLVRMAGHDGARGAAAVAIPPWLPSADVETWPDAGSRGVAGTIDGALVGTPAYMAPEQARGEQVDHRADLYALGAVLYRCLTGQTPFVARDTPALLYAVAHQMPRRPGAIAEVSTDLDAFLAVALAKPRDARFQSAAELVAAFSEAVSDRLSDVIHRRARSLLRQYPWYARDDTTQQIPGLARLHNS